jgi:uncharacterized membrane protein SpoIIM required for sporulation
MTVDLDAYVGARSREWARLHQLSRRRTLTGAEADEFLDLYQRASTHLSVVRSASPDPSVVTYLSGVLARARLTTVGSGVSVPVLLLRFVTRTFPAALYRLRWWWIGMAIGSLLVAFGAGLWTMNHPEVYTNQLTQEQINTYVNSSFSNYYSEYAHHEFATKVWVNNAWVCAQAIAFGVLGLPTLYVMYSNALNLGVSGALMISHGRGGLFFGMILPHGLLELTAVFIAGGVGARLFMSWISPGARTRLQAFAHEGRTAVAVVLGLVGVLLVSGFIEGFVTPSPLPTWARIAFGVVVESLFLAYVFLVGRRAVADGATGDVELADQEAVAPVSM